MEIILCYTTIDTEAKANAMANNLVAEKLIACANIYPIQSIYNWKNELQNEQEWRIDMKTTAALKNKLVAKVEVLHSYEVPAIVIKAIETNLSFSKWVEEMTC